MRNTLRLYFGWHFVRWILGMFVGILLIVFLIDCLELLRSSGGKTGASVGMLVLASALRIPVLMEQVFPFVVLLGSIAAFVTLSHSSQLVIARAAGLSVWQFSLPGIAIAFLLGVFVTTVYNPLATVARSASDDILRDGRASVMATLFSGNATVTWTRQQMQDGNAVLHLSGVADGGSTILSPTFWVFGADGLLSERVEAEYAQLEEGAWRLSIVTVVDRTGSPRTMDTYRIPTQLTAQQVASGLESPSAISFWRLPAAVAQAVASSLPPYRFSLQFQVLLAQPFLLAAMVLIAATVSLGQARSGGSGRMILGGIGAGFVLYVVMEIARELGSEGLVSPVLAAWAPSVVALLLGSTVLLFREDG
jgi:lipopolysaccharide export system permease protein